VIGQRGPGWAKQLYTNDNQLVAVISLIIADVLNSNIGYEGAGKNILEFFSYKNIKH
jgi:hypothetical protein